MDPMTMIAVGQASVQLYGMLRPGGRGVAGLLSAQTRMLVEISKQIEVINGRLVLIHKSLQELKELVHKLPDESAIAATKLELEGYFMHAGELLGRLSEHQLRWGRAKAVSMVQQETSMLLYDLNNARSSLISDKSEALCPIVAASWYVELQLMGNCIPFDATRLAYVARSYDRAFDYWLSSVIKPELQEATKEAIAMRDGIRSSSAYVDYNCNHSISTDKVKRRAGGGGKEGSPYHFYEYTIAAKHSKLTAQPSPVRERLELYQTGLGTLGTTGVEIDSAYKEIAPLRWTVTSGNYGGFRANDDRNPNAKREYHAALASLQQNECKEPPSFAEEFAAQENARAEQSEKLFLKTLLYGNYLVICQEAQKSARSIMERAAKER
jgi:hypothetical protein